MEDVQIHIVTPNTILALVVGEWDWKILSKWHFARKWKMEGSLNIWNRNSFQTIFL